MNFGERERERESPNSSREGGGEWSGGAMVLGKLSFPRRSTNLDNSRKGPTALAVGAG